MASPAELGKAKASRRGSAMMLQVAVNGDRSNAGGGSGTECPAVGVGWHAELTAEVAAQRRRGTHARPRRDLLDAQVRRLQQFLCPPYPLGQQPAQWARPGCRVEVPREVARAHPG